MSFADRLRLVTAPALGLKMMPEVLDPKSTHTDVANAHLTYITYL